jgi:hypothetical protein
MIEGSKTQNEPEGEKEISDMESTGTVIVYGKPFRNYLKS